MNGLPLWITLIGFAAPLLTLAGSAVAYVVKIYRDASETRRNHFFELMRYIDSRDLPIATKSAAVYQLRQFPKHKDFIIRFCEAHKENICGDAAASLKSEMERTIDFMKTLR